VPVWFKLLRSTFKKLNPWKLLPDDVGSLIDFLSSPTVVLKSITSAFTELLLVAFKIARSLNLSTVIVAVALAPVGTPNLVSAVVPLKTV